MPVYYVDTNGTEYDTLRKLRAYCGVSIDTLNRRWKEGIKGEDLIYKGRLVTLYCMGNEEWDARSMAELTNFSISHCQRLMRKGIDPRTISVKKYTNTPEVAKNNKLPYHTLKRRLSSKWSKEDLFKSTRHSQMKKLIKPNLEPKYDLEQLADIVGISIEELEKRYHTDKVRGTTLLYLNNNYGRCVLLPWGDVFISAGEASEITDIPRTTLNYRWRQGKVTEDELYEGRKDR